MPLCSFFAGTKGDLSFDAPSEVMLVASTVVKKASGALEDSEETFASEYFCP